MKAAGLRAASLSFLHLPNGQFSRYALDDWRNRHAQSAPNWLLAFLSGSHLAAASGSAPHLAGVTRRVFLYLAGDAIVDFHRLAIQQLVPPTRDPGGAWCPPLVSSCFFQGTVGGMLWFYVAYALRWLIGDALGRRGRYPGLAVHHTKVFKWSELLAESMPEAGTGMPAGGPVASAVGRSSAGIRDRSGVGAVPATAALVCWLPNCDARDTSNPFTRMILACRSLHLPLQFFNRAVAPATPSFPQETRQQCSQTFWTAAPIHLYTRLA